MDRAIAEALKVKKDVPVGAIIIKDNAIIASAHNLKEESKDVTAHAEILAIRQAQKLLNNWRLDGCSMYVTLEPCPMCGWAIIQSRIDSLYFGSYDNQYGAFTIFHFDKAANSNIKIYGGINEEKCNMLLEQFFKEIR
ncbi:MAG: nucleoside deaminase [Candidatus Gastranaerophilaceae bacterium]